VKTLSLSSPAAVAVDATGTVYVGDSLNRIVRIAPDGVAATIPGFTGRVYSLVLDATGNLYATETGNGKQWIWRISPAGTIEKIAGNAMDGGIADESPQRAIFDGLASIAIGPNKSLYAADSRYRISHIVLENAPLTLLELCTSVSAVTGNAELTGWVSLNRPAQKDVAVSLVSDDPSVSVPQQAIIPAGRSWSAFPISVTARSNPAKAAIRALRDGVFRSASLDLKPEPTPVLPSPFWGKSMRIRATLASGQNTVPVVIDLIPDNDRHRALVQCDPFVFDFDPVPFAANSFHATVLGTRNEVKGSPYSVVTAADLNFSIEGGRVTGTLGVTIRTLAPLGIVLGYSYWRGPIEGPVQ
jgi:hypothetical protein